jgi:hypothetical protein
MECHNISSWKAAPLIFTTMRTSDLVTKQLECIFLFLCMYHNAQSTHLFSGKKPNNWVWEKAYGYTMSLSHPFVASFTLMDNLIGFQGHEVEKIFWGCTFEYVLSSFICSVVQLKKMFKKNNCQIQDRRIM